MQTLSLGEQGLQVSRIGLGCMGMSWAYGQADEVQALKTLHRALELGVVFWDTANIYGDGANEKLLSVPLKTYRQRIILATKAGIVERRSDGYLVNGRPEYLHRCCEQSLKRLGVEVLDLFYLHRVDPDVPVEESIGSMGELVRKGYVRHLGLSEASEATVRRAHGEFPLSALQSEYSLFSRGIESKILPTLRELKIGLVAFSPLGRGLLTGSITETSTLDEGDSRRSMPRFSAENLARNLKLVDRVKQVARGHGATPAQVAIAWLLHQGPEVVPIPGTKRSKYLEANVDAVELKLSPQDLKTLDFAPEDVAGDRYPAELLKAVEL